MRVDEARSVALSDETRFSPAVRLPLALMALVDEWRERQTVPPSRTKAVCWLVQNALLYEHYGTTKPRARKDEAAE